MSGASEPNWSCLPHDPQAFFGLADDFDRKQLKRAYNALIRRYKPERHPAEFQRIRGAFELLDSQLRYGGGAAAAFAAAYEWSAAESAPAAGGPPAAAAAEPAAEAAAPTLAERLRSEPPRRLYRELQQRPDKTPYEFYALAVLSDVVADDRLLFLKWLLTGLKAHPDEPGLAALLYEYFQGELPAAQLPSILSATSQVVRNDRFYFLTEKLWDRLLAEAEFPQFRAALEKCEKNLRDHRIEGRLTFYVHLLRAAVWKADPQWVERAYGIVQEHHASLPPSLEFDLEMLDAVREYLATKDESVGDNPVRQRIHLAIEAYFSLPEQQADHHVVACQSALADDGAAVLDAFPIAGGELVEPMLGLWHWINEDVGQRQELLEGAAEDLPRQLFRLLRGLDKAYPPSMSQVLTYLATVNGPYVLFALTPFVLLWPWLGGAGYLWSAALGGVLVGFHRLWFKKHVAEEWFFRYMRKVMGRRYRRDWRARFLPLLEASQATHDELLRALMLVIRDSEQDLNASVWVTHFLPSDTGLAFFALAARVAR